MAALLQNFRNTIILSVVLALVMVVGYATHYSRANGGALDAIFWQAVFRWMHVFFGILWIGLLYYFNFVQIRVMPNIPAELKPAVSKYIAPEALFWFRWAALATWVMGVILAFNRGYLVQAFTLGAVEGFHVPKDTFIGIGMWLATIMFFNVWVFIWPNQKIALGIVEADADAKAKANRTAMLFSRTNTLLSIPMLVTMTMNQTVF
ncbi:MAG: urate hydroxylase PuuD, partial [Caulobacteraceae bacterium]|nr:urate hydroxylase PuuD [Caulobacteraceae bacterium]